VDAKRIVIFVVVLVALVFAGKRACDAWHKFHPTIPPAPAAPQPAPGQPAPPPPAQR